MVQAAASSLQQSFTLMYKTKENHFFFARFDGFLVIFFKLPPFDNRFKPSFIITKKYYSNEKNPDVGIHDFH